RRPRLTAFPYTTLFRSREGGGMSGMHDGPGRCADLAALAYPEVEALLGDGRPSVAILPTGSIEAHGPHLPLDTDTLISDEVARRDRKSTRLNSSHVKIS